MMNETALTLQVHHHYDDYLIPHSQPNVFLQAMDLAMLATDLAMAVTVLDMPSGRGRLRLSPALAMAMVLVSTNNAHLE